MRNFKINGIRFEIGNICDNSYKYEVYMLSDNMLIGIGKSNTLREGKEVACNYIEKIKEIEEYNKKAQETERKYIEKLGNTKIYCSECGKELDIDEKIHLEDICTKCVKTYY